MPIPSQLPFLSGFLLSVAFLMFSCAWSSSPDRLEVHNDHHFHGMAHVTPCAKEAPSSEIFLDEKGFAKTSLCPAADHGLQVEVIEDGRHTTIAQNQTRVLRAGDGFAVQIEVNLASN